MICNWERFFRQLIPSKLLSQKIGYPGDEMMQFQPTQEPENEPIEQSEEE